MSYKMTIKQPNMADGAEIYIAGLGTFQNGKVYKVSEAAAEGFRVLNARVVSEGGQTRQVLGTPLDEVNIYGVTVEKQGEPARESDSE